ncbi:MAG TPA: acylphosphatase, partial [Pyrinomonadaceae bacterium]|nr:acylphosphatase [Pyrinomonadaceae bacterium]
LAKEFNVCGSIINNGNGVEIIAQATAENLENFISAFQNEAPKLARIDEITRTNSEILPNISDFQISESKQTEIHTGVVPDASVCE